MIFVWTGGFHKFIIPPIADVTHSFSRMPTGIIEEKVFLMNIWKMLAYISIYRIYRLIKMPSLEE